MCVCVFFSIGNSSNRDSMGSTPSCMGEGKMEGEGRVRGGEREREGGGGGMRERRGNMEGYMAYIVV